MISLSLYLEIKLPDKSELLREPLSFLVSILDQAYKGILIQYFLKKFTAAHR